MQRGRVLTLWDLRGQWRGDGDEVAILAAVVHGHLAPLARVADVTVALGHEQLQGIVSVHEHTWGEGGGSCVSLRGGRGAGGWEWGCPRAHSFLSRLWLPVLPGGTGKELASTYRGDSDGCGNQAGGQTRKHRPVPKGRSVFQPPDSCSGTLGGPGLQKKAKCGL